MTVVIGLRIPGQGAVLMADGQITDDDGRVWSRDARKLLMLPDVVMGVCGHFTVLDHIREAGIKDYVALKKMALKKMRTDQGMPDFGLVCYDKKKDRLFALETLGVETTHEEWVTEGAGAQFAAGAIEAMRRPRNLDEALKVAHKAVSVACHLHSSCGGDIQWFKVPLDGKITDGILKIK